MRAEVVPDFADEVIDLKAGVMDLVVGVIRPSRGTGGLVTLPAGLVIVFVLVLVLVLALGRTVDAKAGLGPGVDVIVLVPLTLDGAGGLEFGLTVLLVVTVEVDANRACKGCRRAGAGCFVVTAAAATLRALKKGSSNSSSPTFISLASLSSGNPTER